MDAAVRDVLRLKFRLGLFENAIRSAVETAISPDAREAAEESAAQGVVLLKNEKAILPLATA